MKFYSKARRFLHLVLSLLEATVGLFALRATDSGSPMFDCGYRVVSVLLVVGAVTFSFRGATGYVEVDGRGVRVRNPFRSYFVPWSDFEGTGIANGAGWQMMFGPVLYSRGRKPIPLCPVMGMFVLIGDGEGKALNQLRECLANHLSLGPTDQFSNTRLKSKDPVQFTFRDACVNRCWLLATVCTLGVLLGSWLTEIDHCEYAFVVSAVTGVVFLPILVLAIRGLRSCVMIRLGSTNEIVVRNVFRTFVFESSFVSIVEKAPNRRLAFRTQEGQLIAPHAVRSSTGTEGALLLHQLHSLGVRS